VTDNTGNVLGGICYAALGKNGQPAGNSGADGVPDGFPDPVDKYHAVESEVNKRFANNWQLLANWRIARVEGNYEGHFRSDNQQTDPAISSLFDFTAGEFNLLGDQFAVGPLNTDRRHVVNLYGSYAFSEKGHFSSFKPIRGLNIGAGLHMESGLPIRSFWRIRSIRLAERYQSAVAASLDGLRSMRSSIFTPTIRSDSVRG
jgi:hypothetical protein